MKRYFRESEEGKNLTPEQAQIELDKRDGETPADIGEDKAVMMQAFDPARSDYDEREDPEMMEEAFIGGFNRIKESKRFREAASWIKDEIFDYWDENGFDDSEEAFNDFFQNFYVVKGTPVNGRARKERWDAAVSAYLKSSGNRAARAQADEAARQRAEEEAYRREHPYEGVSSDTEAWANRINSAPAEDLGPAASARTKYERLHNQAYGIFMGENFKKHVFVCGDAGVGKTYEVEKIAKEDWPKSPLRDRGWKYTYNKGSIGTSSTDVISYFFEHREKEILVLDDADGFLKSGNADIMNLLKGILNSENILSNPQPTMTTKSIQIRKGAASSLMNPEKALRPTDTENRFLHGEFENKPPVEFLLNEDVNPINIHINQEKFDEGILEVSMNGKVVTRSRLTESDKQKYEVVSAGELRRQREAKNLLGLGYTRRLTEGDEDYIEEEEIEGMDGAEDLPWNPYLGGGTAPNGKYMLPENIIFTSRLIMVSNLAPAEVNDAFRSRCEMVAITLTHDEFIAHLGVVINGLMKKMETLLDPEVINYCKMQAYGYLIKCVELEGRPLGDRTVEVNVPLQFRLVADIAGQWYASAVGYARNHGLGKVTMENIKTISVAIEPTFVMYTLLPFLADSEYSGDKSKKRR